jgi:hypothetical protein
MCDYSLESRLSRPAVVGEEIETFDFGGTHGFKSVTDPGGYQETTAICLLPGTEIAFDAPVQTREWAEWSQPNNTRIEHPAATIEHKVARFAKVHEGEAFQHHDGLEFPDRLGGETVLLHHLVAGQKATVLQLPADIEAAKKLDESTRPVVIVREMDPAGLFD